MATGACRALCTPAVSWKPGSSVRISKNYMKMDTTDTKVLVLTILQAPYLIKSDHRSLGWDHHDPEFTEEEIKAQRDSETC